MTKLEIPNGFYCDARPDRNYACLMNGFQSIQTSLGIINCEVGPPLYLRISQSGPLKITGQNLSDKAIEFNQSWNQYGVAFGTSPCIYDNFNKLNIATPSVGVQGFRFVDAENRIWTGDETYYSPIFNLSEWSGLDIGLDDNYAIGQSPDDDFLCLFFDGAKHHVVEGGKCRFIRVARNDNDVSIAMVKMGNQPSIIIWTTIAELKTLPLWPVVPPVKETDITPFLR